MTPGFTGERPLIFRVLMADDEDDMVRTVATVLALADYQACAVYVGDALTSVLALLQPRLLLTNVDEAGALTEPIPSLEERGGLPRFHVLLCSAEEGWQQLLQQRKGKLLPFEVLLRPASPADLLQKLRSFVSGGRPALFMPMPLAIGVH